MTNRADLTPEYSYKDFPKNSPEFVAQTEAANAAVEAQKVADREARIKQRAVDTAATEAKRKAGLTLKKADKTELQFVVDGEIAAYKATVQGREFTMSVDRAGNTIPVHGLFNSRGGITQVYNRTPVVALGEADKLLKEGYSLFLHKTPIVTPEMFVLYLIKPDSLQAADIEYITKQATDAYEASIEAHNERVFEQERQAMLVEEAQAREAIKREDAAKEEAEIEKRVQARIRGMKAAK